MIVVVSAPGLPLARCSPREPALSHVLAPPYARTRWPNPLRRPRGPLRPVQVECLAHHLSQCCVGTRQEDLFAHEPCLAKRTVLGRGAMTFRRSAANGQVRRPQRAVLLGLGDGRRHRIGQEEQNAPTGTIDDETGRARVCRPVVANEVVRVLDGLTEGSRSALSGEAIGH